VPFVCDFDVVTCDQSDIAHRPYEYYPDVHSHHIGGQGGERGGEKQQHAFYRKQLTSLRARTASADAAEKIRGKYPNSKIIYFSRT
jgi:hypothetical protein